MTAELRAPVAIRITRPYSTEDEYLDHELDTLTRASITLVGAQPRAEGVVLRFELVLATGQVLLRGEGRVVGFKPNALQGVGGLALRFTRLDTRSKALVDKAAGLRERRRPSFRSATAAPPAPSPPASRSPLPARPSSPPAASPSPVPPQPFAPAPASSPSPVPPQPFAPASSPSPVPAPPSTPPAAAMWLRPASTSSAPPAAVAGALGRPTRATLPPDVGAKPLPERDALLERLRTRAKTVDPAMVRRLLASRGSS